MKFYNSKNSQKGFTLIELMFVIAIIAMLASIVLAAMNSARKQGRDAQRLSDIRQIQTALDLYYDKYGYYPANSDNDCSGWDVGLNGGKNSGDTFIQPLIAEGFLRQSLGDPTNTSSCGGYRYYRYGAGSGGCDSSRGGFYVLEINDLESSNRPHPQSPGFSCSGRNWGTEADWVVGKFEK